MIAQQADRKLPMLITKSELLEYPALLPYSKHDVLRALTMYEKKKYYDYRQVTELHKARRAHGTQFLIDLFLMTEIYISHWPIYKMCEARRDITSVLSHNPDERIRREEGKGTRYETTKSKPEGTQMGYPRL